jgi:GTP-binding protein
LSPSARGPSGRRNGSPLADLEFRFIGSYADPAVLPDPALPEIAFVGRSNVGKSSLLNALTGRSLARVSATPGKTQLLNIYRAPDFYLVDLPGYGWAKASQADRLAFRRLIEGCLTGRDRLSGVVWLLDIRHEPSVDDYAVQELLIRTGTPCLTVLTKGDKLPRMRRLEAVRSRSQDLGLPLDELLVTSTRTGDGIGDLGESILAAIRSG